MQLQEKIIAAINKNRLDEDGDVDIETTLGFINYLSRTSVFPPSVYPAVIVDDNPFNFSNADSGIIGETQECTLFLIIESKNVNEMTEDEYLGFKTDLYNKMKTLTDTLNAEISRLTFGRGDTNLVGINAVPVMVAEVAVKGLIINKN